MVIDVNTYIGHWPFRQVKGGTAAELVKKLDEAGIDRAVVSTINAIFYKDSQQGNTELAEEIKPYGDRFIPFAVINPMYPGWEKDFDDCIHGLGMRGIELYPYYHNYRLTDGNAVKLINMAAAEKVPVHLPCAIENIRQRHMMDTIKNLSIEEVEQVCARCPQADFIISNGDTHDIAQKLKKVSQERQGRIYYDFARVELFEGNLKKLIDNAGIDRVVLGTVLPFQYSDTQFVKVHYAKLSPEDKEKILSGNLSELLKLK